MGWIPFQEKKGEMVLKSELGLWERGFIRCNCTFFSSSTVAFSTSKENSAQSRNMTYKCKSRFHRSVHWVKNNKKYSNSQPVNVSINIVRRRFP